ncbi:hypothetical protein PFNF135_01830 [Plasmodium falciparum NF135/5.C10]|uniref:Erythrocyte membrane protein 1 n=3 Tax=Plasmodium falciparum TaxID=5833 RepID=W4IJ75_PLAFA|nr:hypothetical protein PFNF135_01830 [Plasmodium falciparum NF135/5.C10]
MVLPKRAPTATIDYTKVTNVKELLDLIGKYIQQKVHGEALEHSNSQLHGFLSKVIFSGGHKTNVFNKCDIDEQYETNVTDGHSHPCLSRKDVRFSYTEGAECDKSKIKGSNSKSEGACAPLRRLSLCDQNLEHIKPENIKDTHNLYIDVLLAAKYEGQMIAKKLQEYDPTNYKSRICTELARSFADIGDIIRGKDLYLGYNKKEKAQKEKLEQNLKFFFQNIDDKLDPEAKNYYAKEKDPDFLKLREDWWELNRQDIWKALTCNAPNDAKYFRKTVCARGTTPTHEKCTCASGDVPTYFDYVPQYLRCRNGYDCEQTVNARGKLRYGKQCISCLYACNPYVEWIDKQRKQFDKQKNKYAEEIKKYENGASRSSRRKRRGAPSNNNYEGYEKKFYDQLNKSDYRTVDDFLDLLSKENVCTNINDNDGGRINFKQVNSTSGGTAGGGASGTFYRSKYCQPCPDCGMKWTNGGKGKWEEKNNGQCTRGNLYRPKDKAKGTLINFLYSGDGPTEIEKKLDAFCQTQNGKSGKASSSGSDDCGGNSDSSLCEPWKCYKGEDVEIDGKDEEDNEENVEKVKGAGGLCILETTNHEGVQKQKTYNDFFNFWVAHMLKDSIYWRGQVGGCLKNKSEKCKNGCNKKCDCFAKWVVQKEKEWTKIKEHFKTQNIKGKGGNGNTLESIPFGHDDVLEQVLEKGVLLTSLREGYGNAKDIKHIEALLDEENEKNQQEATGGASSGENNTTIDKLLKHELTDANRCKDCEQPQERGVAGRSLPSVPAGPTVDSTGSNDAENADEDEDDDDDDDEESEEEEEKKEEETTKDSATTKQGEEEVAPKEGSPASQEDDVNVCKTVEEALTIDNLKQACPTKYGPKAPTSWKCIPSGDKTDTGSNSGAICVPPRRRRLYIQKLPDAEFDDASLRDWFVKSAAVETFFLWHKYKMDRKPPPKEESGLGGSSLLLGVVDDEEEKQPSQDVVAQQKLQSGEIPEEFKRQMFYTLGDYRDICIGKTPHGIDAVITSDQKDKEANIKLTMKDISENIKKAIEQILPKNGDKPAPKPSDDPRKTWWEANGEHIWEGMVCALTYDTNSGGEDKKIEQVNTANGTDLFEKLKGKYQYSTVKLHEETNGAKGQTESTSSSDTPTPKTTLKNFVERPPYFRYLEEWGQNFCKERKKRLEKIKEECKVDEDGRRGKNGNKKCSGYGEHCDDQLSKNSYDTVPSLECPRCNTSCRSYKKWIEKKKTEYEKQRSAYGQQKENYVNGNNKGGGDNGFCETLEKDAAEFLQKLGPCKKDSGEVKKFFDKNGDTFKHAKDCNPCSEFKINCTKAKCTGDDTKGKCNGSNETTTITASDIENGGNSTHKLDMLVSDNSGNEFNGLQACITSGIFQGIKENKYKCANVCGYVVCKPKNGNGETTSGENNDQIITIRALVTHWVQNFLEDYNKIRRKLNLCTKNDKESSCINGCKDKCSCVEKWISTKKEEWRKIKELYLQQYKDKNQPDYPVKTVLEDFESRPELDKAIKPCNGLDKFKGSCGLNGDESSEKKGAKDNDLVLCLLDRLKTKVTSCPAPTSGEKQTTCGEYTHPDDEEPLEETENPVDPPKICENVLKTPPKQEDESGCKPAPTTPKETEPTSGGEQTPILKPEEEAPEPEVPPTKAPADEPFNRDILEKTIPFGIAFALGSIAFLFLKKKTKSSVGNLFQILQIPKGDDTQNDIQNDIPSRDTPMNKFTDEEWNQLKDDFISNMLQNEPNDVPNDYSSGDIPFNTQPNTLYFNKPEEKPFITSIHDRNLYTGEEYNYNVNMSTNTNNDIPKYVSNNVYSGIDLINDTLSGNEHIDIYDEVLKRKENELFGTNHPKRTSTYSVAKNTNSDPIHNQLNLFHTWLDRHRDMCKKWNNKEGLLDKLKEKWNKDTNSGKLSDNIHRDNHVLNSDVSIQIDMGNPKYINQFTCVDSNPDRTFPSNPNLVENNTYVNTPTNVQIEMDVNNHKVVKEKYPISDISICNFSYEIVGKRSRTNVLTRKGNIPNDWATEAA